jgi:5'-3' exonuclease
MSNLLDTFNEMNFSPTDEDLALNSRVLIVDGMNTFIRSFAAIPTMDEDGTHVGGVTGFLKSVGWAIRELKPTRVFVVFDGKGGSHRRKKMFPEYKNHRKPLTRLNRQYNEMTTPKEDGDMMKYEMTLVARALQNLPITTISYDGVEADDIMAYITHQIDAAGGESILYSTDKDFLQLVSDSVKVWHPMKKVMYDADMVVKDHGIHPTNFLMYRALTGDKSDNIGGVKGVGKATILKKFPKFATEERVELQELLDASSLYPKASLMKRIIENSDIIERNLVLMSLGELYGVCMSSSTKLNVLDRINAGTPKMDKHGLTKLLLEYKIIPLLGNYNNWVLNSFTPLSRYDV